MGQCIRAYQGSHICPLNCGLILWVCFSDHILSPSLMGGKADSWLIVRSHLVPPKEDQHDAKVLEGPRLG